MLAGLIWVSQDLVRKISVLSQQHLRANGKVNCSKDLQEFAKAMKHKKKIICEAEQHGTFVPNPEPQK